MVFMIDLVPDFKTKTVIEDSQWKRLFAYKDRLSDSDPKVKGKNIHPLIIF